MDNVILAEMPAVKTTLDFEALVQSHARFVFKVGCAVLRNAENVEDIVQETFLRAFQSGEAGKVERVRDWLARIAWRLAALSKRRLQLEVTAAKLK
jgi:DNA-directed RNA polymerase specialized sigma24 family protein